MAFAVSTVIGVAGLAVAGAGIGLNLISQHDAAARNAAAAEDQAAIGALQSNNVDVQKQQLSLQTSQQQLQIQTQKGVIEDQAQADTIRQQAAQLDATRRTREAVRQEIVARSQSLTRATNQGAAAPGSSAVQQSTASISGQTDVNLLGITQNSEIGKKLYDINKDITSKYLSAQDANSAYVNQSQSLQNSVLDTQKKIYALGGDASSNYAQAALSSGNTAIGAGLMSFGSAVTNSYPTINRLTNYFGASSGTNYAQQLANGEIPV